MKKLLPFTILFLSLQGCVAISAVTAIPGALVDVVANQLVGEEKSYPASMRQTLAAVQRTLWELKLDIDVLEIQPDGGYGVGFGNDRLDGEITLRKQTSQLTTVYVKAKGKTREESVEQAIIDLVDGKLSKLSRSTRFDASKYNNLRKEPSITSTRVGWFRPGANLEATNSTTKDWLKIKLPSGKYAYLKGVIMNNNASVKRKSILSKSE